MTLFFDLRHTGIVNDNHFLRLSSDVISCYYN